MRGNAPCRVRGMTERKREQEAEMALATGHRSLALPAGDGLADETTASRRTDDDLAGQAAPVTTAAAPESAIGEDELSKQIKRAQADKEFQARLQASMEEHKELLDLLAES